MIIHNIRINNFKSLYGEHYFDFDKCKGLIKLSGPIGSGKTSLAESIIYGLYGTVKGQNNTNLISWNEKFCEVEINLESKNKKVRILRNIKEPLIVEVNGHLIAASNKRDTQSILEEEILDVPKLAVIKMCIISFTQFNSLANMNPAETKQFLDEILGFKLFSDYNDKIVDERKNQQNEEIKLQALYDDVVNQIETLKHKQLVQTTQIKESLDIDKLNEERKELVNQGISLKNKKESIKKEQQQKDREYDSQIRNIQNKITEIITLGKQAKNHYNTFKSGICPTCGQKIDQVHIDEYKNKMDKYAKEYKVYDAQKIEIEQQKTNIHNSYNEPINECDIQMDELRNKINKLDSDIKIYNESVQLIKSNYEELINDQETKLSEINKKLNETIVEIAEWNEMNVLFTKTLRYNLLESLIPHINKSIYFFINKLDQSFKVEYDQEFKPHIYVDGWEKEITYSNLSTGQKKTLDLAIIFGILQNIISTVNMNIIFLDELFSNLDSETRNTMLSLLNETMSKDKSVFVVNHAEMQDDFFSHKIRVRLENKKIRYIRKKEENEVVIKCSKYEQIF